MKKSLQESRQEIVFVSALDLLAKNQHDNGDNPSDAARRETRLPIQTTFDASPTHAAITDLAFPFALKADQVKAVEAWLANGARGSIIYGSGTGKTEIAFECAKRLAKQKAKDSGTGQNFSILILVPRIVLIDQNFKRLVRYQVSPEKIGKFFGEEKQANEITIATYHSALANLKVVEKADMVIFDEMHLARGAFSRILDVVKIDQDKALLGLTATIDENDPKNAAITSLLPPVRKYLIKDAVLDRRLARPIVFPIKVSLTGAEQKQYNEYSEKIRNISRRFKRYDAKDMMALMNRDGFPRWQARAWFLNVKKRKQLLASSDNKLEAAVNLIAEKHPRQKVMVFSETLESVRKLKQLLKSSGIDSALIDSKTPSFRRQKILSDWGKRFFVLLSVHTLEIGYDVPEAGVEIILATSSNMNQIVQRVGRVLRKVEGKDSASVYLVYVSDTKDDNILAIVRQAIEASGGGESRKGERDGTDN
jgi:superfamily II DNA or RNA helicase